MKKPLLLFIILLIAACNNPKVEYDYPQDPSIVRRNRGGKFFNNQNLVIYGKQNQSPNSKDNAVSNQPNKALWIASFEVISALLPISVADQNSGIIITEWYQNDQNANERIKINLLIKNPEPKPENLVISIFKQSHDKNGNWEDQKSSENNMLANMIREKIIDKAKTIPIS